MTAGAVLVGAVAMAAGVLLGRWAATRGAVRDGLTIDDARSLAIEAHDLYGRALTSAQRAGRGRTTTEVVRAAGMVAASAEIMAALNGDPRTLANRRARVDALDERARPTRRG